MAEPRRLPAATARRRRVALAGHHGDEATARSGLTDDDAGVRATALGALARIGVLTVEDLRAASADASAPVRGRAAELVPGTLATEDATSLLLELLSDDDATVIEVAAWACGEVEDSTAAVVDRLSALVAGHDDALVREAAVAALGAIGDPRGLPAILSATHDKPAVRRRAVIALAPFDGPEVDAALVRASQDRDWQVRQAAEDLMS